MQNIEVVHVIFKTHLDIGFTDLAQNVTNQYINSYIPKAIELSESLARDEDKAGFVWTTGSWLIHEYLTQANKEEREMMEDAINKGYISWHGLPFTTHTELMDTNLFNYGLSIAKRLDESFSKKTIASKMTDVPGHTKAMIPLMAKQGIKYLHLGVNPASKIPSVPSIFVWKGTDGSDIIVNYADNYGDVLLIEELNEVMVFAHTGDNCGPPSLEDIKKEFKKLKERFPNAEIKASTMDAFAAKLEPFKNKLPVVYEEIGDTWIHGAGTDPSKVAQYRELLRLRNKWIEQNKSYETSEECRLFSDFLLLIPEHTWGLDEKKFLNDYKNYSKAAFNHAREQDEIQEDSVPDKYNYIGSFAMNEFDEMSEQMFMAWEGNSYKLFESSWKEQRGFIKKAVKCLSDEKRNEVKEAFASLKPQKHEYEKSRKTSVATKFKFSNYEVEFDIDGSISYLADNAGKEWVNESNRLGVFCYESFGVENYNTWFEQYVENTSRTHHWSDADQGKPGMELVTPKPEYKEYKPRLVNLTEVDTEDSTIIKAKLTMPEASVELFGAPKEVVIDYKFYKNNKSIDIEVNWFNKQANRLPEALWFSFNLNVDNPNMWKMEKMGDFISPLEVVKDGNRNLHAINSGLHYHGADGKAIIDTKDAPLVSPGEKRFLQFDNTAPPLKNGFHINLYNNIWGTNFPMWYEEDAKFRFSLKLDSYK
ncbi:DUF5054 domain-containing protein [Virgibacillus litoralis]|uniref:DUF5054 domain-containing protein n=1 Tax=Virgibacillus litoralis TaxID=578221 RepID=A0ABS4HAE8_9BACI|nr:DUF5054 domain-containing protein [Virgibacillus litoralis]MBP1947875.1 hypothetical protein [Virgibacillus litoralis]